MIRRLAAGLALALVIGIGASVTTPPEAAHATNCSNSLTCNPANLPILTELGIVTTEAGTTAVVPATTAGAAAGVNWGAFWSAAIGGVFAGAATVLGPAFMTSMGWDGVELLPNPEYEIELDTDPCTGYTLEVVSAYSAKSDLCGRVGGYFRSLATPRTYMASANYLVTARVDPIGVEGRATLIVDWELLPSELPRSAPVGYQEFMTVQLFLHCFNASNNSRLTGISAVIPTTGDYGTFTMTCPTGSTGSTKMQLQGGTAEFTGGSTVQPTAGYGYIFDHQYGSLELPRALIKGEVRSTVTCQKPDLTTYDVWAIATFEADGVSGVQIPDAKCDTSELAIAGVVEWRPLGTTEWLELIGAEAPPAVQEWRSDYEACFIAEFNPCTITLWRVGPDGDLTTCGTIGQYCPDWATTDPDLIASRYKCKYGPYVTDINMCSAYRAPTVGPQPNVDEDGAWLPVTAPPVTPNPVSNDTLIDLGFDPGLFIDTIGTGDCWPSGWGVLNPLSWVLLPVQCALQWAFVPRVAVVEATAVQLDMAVNESLFGDVQYLADALSAPFAIGSTGCTGPAFTIQIEDLGGDGMNETYYPLNACDEPMQGFAGFFRLISQGFVMIGSGFAVLRYFASIVGFVGYGGAGNPARVRFDGTES